MYSPPSAPPPPSPGAFPPAAPAPPPAARDQSCATQIRYCSDFFHFFCGCAIPLLRERVMLRPSDHRISRSPDHPIFLLFSAPQRLRGEPICLCVPLCPLW